MREELQFSPELLEAEKEAQKEIERNKNNASDDSTNYESIFGVDKKTVNLFSELVDSIKNLGDSNPTAENVDKYIKDLSKIEKHIDASVDFEKNIEKKLKQINTFKKEIDFTLDKQEHEKTKDKLLIYLQSKEAFLTEDPLIKSIKENSEKEIEKTSTEFESDINFGILKIKDKPTFEQEKEKIHKSEGYHDLKNIFDGLETEDKEWLIDSFMTKSLSSPENRKKAKEDIRTNYFLLLREEKEARRNNEEEKIPEIDKFRSLLSELSAKLEPIKTKKENYRDEESYEELFSIIADSTGETKETIAENILKNSNSTVILEGLVSKLADPDSLEEPEDILKKFYKENSAHA